VGDNVLKQYNQVLIHKLEQKLAQLEANEKHLRLAAAVFEHTTEAILITDADVNIVTVNPAFSRITGYGADEVLGKSPNLLQSGRHDSEFYRTLWTDLKQRGQWQGEIWNRRKDGSIYPELLAINVVRDEHDQIVNYLAVFTDIRDFKHLQEELTFLAHHDPLTGLPNRTLFNLQLQQAIERAKRKASLFALLCLDLDRFKPVNDSYGHPVGDKLLIEVAQRLKAVLRSVDSVSRIGGDEFNLLLDELESPEAAGLAADRLIAAIAQPFEIDGHCIDIGASIGIALWQRDATDIVTLHRHADAALYQAKAAGRGAYCNFQP